MHEIVTRCAQIFKYPFIGTTDLELIFPSNHFFACMNYDFASLTPYINQRKYYFARRINTQIYFVGINYYYFAPTTYHLILGNVMMLFRSLETLSPPPPPRNNNFFPGNTISFGRFIILTFSRKYFRPFGIIILRCSKIYLFQSIYFFRENYHFLPRK